MIFGLYTKREHFKLIRSLEDVYKRMLNEMARNLELEQMRKNVWKERAEYWQGIVEIQKQIK